ncbi:DNA helicase-2/ATP-dependent DNA helicase PcrA [Microcella alkaliphila]|uniref:DNA 3'-5' helicase n=1 Tax=Microcella alkaliphila TaxID=279828 RepID=A0A4Q7TF32_9MICO|nr:ATP-dependent DNA helicase [Microcella alkaliphila]RZT58150.1 DNA helicase-2/ATP-dependent DNA helicase PcrA [Microcella alkaliphila]
MSAPRYTALQIAEVLGQPSPTGEQRSVIEAPLGPALVVAGAGSGKTETMAARVLWLVANGLVAPEQVLGLTFTRKAASELAHRIRERLVALGSSSLFDGRDAPPVVDAFTQPTVATYNAFASSLYRDNAVLIGRDPDGVVLGAAAAWQLARGLVSRATDERLADHDLTVDRVTTAVLDLAHALTEHLVEPDAVRAALGEFSSVADLPPGGRGAYADVDALVATLAPTLPLLDLAEQYAERKRRDGLIEFSDQVALALDLLDRNPEVGEALRQRFRVVLLDEYQDTNVAQTRLLSGLFAGTPVMAVGDPHQSIYGWRGASATNLDDFATRFVESGSDRVDRYSLSTSWRNGRRILDVANALVEPLTARGGVAVSTLEPAPFASDHDVELAQLETVEAEAEHVAAWFAERLGTPAGGAAARDPSGRDAAARAEATGDTAETRPPTAALLMRSRSTQPIFLDALRRRGVPFHVLGIGGLLTQPEIADLVAALHVIDDPSAGTELVRLLAGPRWSIGLADLDALRGVASWLRERDLAQQRFSDEVREALRASVAGSESASIVDALDFVAHAPDGHGQLEAFSELGRVRLREAGRLFAALRRRTSLDLPDLVGVVEHELMLDIEVTANPYRVLGESPRDAFLDALDDYLGLADDASLGGFLRWLREAEWRDNLSPRTEDAEPGTVQVLTIHGSKGLEWDNVAVPRFVADELPSKPRSTRGWLSLGVLPFELRGDAAELPVFGWRGAESRKDLLDRQKVFQQEVGEHLEREERRLAYVAVTRARHRLLLTASFWAGQTKPRALSPFLAPLVQRGLLPAVPTDPAHDENPRAVDDSDEPWWPADPLSGRREALENAAARIRQSGDEASGERDALGWQRDIDLLLAERTERERRAGEVAVPYRVPASAFRQYVNEPEGVAERLRRPMPQRPYRQTRLGTVFHRWVEERFGLGAIVDRVDAGLDDRDVDGDGFDPEALAELQQRFAASEWGDREPLEVECEIHLPLAGHLFVCKLDAVYPAQLRRPDGRFVDGVEIVDWKTGRAPTTVDDRAQKELQLALYRLAYARRTGRPLDEISVALYFVADDLVLRPERLPDGTELARLWRDALMYKEKA